MLLTPAIIGNINEDIDAPAKKKQRKQTNKPSRTWVKKDLKTDLPEWTPDDLIIEELLAKKLTPKNYFELFLTMRFWMKNKSIYISEKSKLDYGQV